MILKIVLMTLDDTNGSVHTSILNVIQNFIKFAFWICGRYHEVKQKFLNIILELGSRIRNDDAWHS